MCPGTVQIGAMAHIRPSDGHDMRKGGAQKDYRD